MPMSRRRLLQSSLAAAVAGYAAAQWGPSEGSAADFTTPPRDAEGLTHRLDGQVLLVRFNNQPLTGYRAHGTQKYPYFFPLTGLESGLSVTTESGLPYPHQRSLWLGCEPLNGGDYWSDGTLATGQVKSAGITVEQSGDSSLVIHDSCEWIRPEAPTPLRDLRRFTLEVVNETLWTLDADLHLTALEDIEIKNAKHSFYAIRAATDISPMYGGVLSNSEGGSGAAGTYGKQARWCGYHGPRKRREEVTEGITVMAHPENALAPLWFTREYGHLSPSPFNFLESPWRLAAGEQLRLRYRVAVHSGSPEKAGMDACYRSWVEC